MKVRSIHIHSLIQKVQQNDGNAQRQLFEEYSAWALGLCRRYFTNIAIAEDVMITSFTKIFQRVSDFENKGSFEAWMRRIIVHECINEIRKTKVYFTELSDEDEGVECTSFSDLQCEQILKLIDTLPNSCKMVFNLYVFEEMTHQEIADNLQINIGTSKSQLAYARKKLQSLYHSLNAIQYGT